MSYVLHAWDSPVPRTLAEAVAVLDRLHDLPACANARLAQFIDTLLARHPCMTTLPPGSHEDVWVDGPMRTDQPGPVYSFGIQTQHLSRVMPFVVASAQAAAVIVMDEQAGVVYLPDGTALTPRGRERVELPQSAEENSSPPKLEALAPALVSATSDYRLYVFLKAMVHKGDCERHIQWAMAKDPVEWQAFAAAHVTGHPYHDYELRAVYIDFSRFERFARRVNRRLRRAELTNSAWIDGRELEESVPRLILPLQLRPDLIARLRPIILEEAAYQGLIVYDPQARLQADPNGSYKIDDEYVGLTDSGDKVSYHVAHARAALEKALQPMLQRLGYQIKREPYVTYVRVHEGVEHEIWPNMSNARAQIKISVSVRLRHEAWPALHQRWPLDGNGRLMWTQVQATLMSFTDAAAFDQFTYKHDEFQLHRDHHFPLLADWCEQTLRARVEPLLARCRSLEALDELLNAPGNAPALAFAGRMPDTLRIEAALVIAHLADRGRFDSACEAAETFLARCQEGSAPDGPSLTPLELAQIREAIDRLVAFRSPSASTTPASRSVTPT